MAKKKPAQAGTIVNRRAKHDYQLGDELIAGIVLSGAETKSLRRGHGHLRGAYVTAKEGELYLVNATITGDRAVPVPEEEQTRSRKLLLKHKQIDTLLAAKQQGNTIVPLALLTKGRFIKLRISAGRGIKQYDKRQVIKKRDESRAIQAELKKSR